MGTVRASRVRAQSGHIRADIATLRERELQSIGFESSKDATGDMTPPAKATLRKSVALKVPYVQLQTYRRELVALHLNFLPWDWNCVLATICKEMMDNSQNESDNLCGNSMPWTLDH